MAIRAAILAGLGLATVSGGAVAQSSPVLPPGCRQEIVRLCGRDRDAIRACLRSRAAELSATCRSALIERAGVHRGREGGRAAPASGGNEFAYGDDARQRLDYWPAAPGEAGPRPLILFIHGGGWSIGDKRQGAGDKSVTFPTMGYGFASTNYRLVPAVTPAEQAADIAAAVALLRRDAVRLGHDPDRIVLMGHSAGAHLAALVATDPRYLQGAGVPMAAIAGVVLLDGAGYDVPRQMADAPGLERFYRPAFGDDPARQQALSPISHVGGEDAARWLILHVAERDQSAEQSQLLGDALRAAGASVEVRGVARASHMSVNRDAGRTGTVEGQAIVGFLAQL